MAGTYECKLEFTKPNKLHTSSYYDTMATGQAPVPGNMHANRWRKDLRFFRKINFHPYGKQYSFRIAVFQFISLEVSV